ncbi:hypothetical protein AOZ06_04810 [Kibdelosporangium phytohabitans]|uniref:Uncharacterized protein n=1 Tax=Kibdelosporangium phytohabitans TaxID=860235 RepID=A0A0N9IDP3_9PSEU|nr:hypothetical protein AOZ06_04810 [Kibdelosporangium phytohabitans]
MVSDRASDLLSRGDRPVTAQLLPLKEALIRATNPRSVIAWLRTSPVVRLIADLVEKHSTISHDHLDALPPNKNVDYLRATLVAIDILPPREEQLSRLGPWINAALADLPAHHLRYLRPFIEWDVLRSARRTAARKGYTISSATRDRSKVRSAIQFLAWIDQQHTDLTSITQAHVDLWITTGPTTRQRARAFLRWTTARKITTPLAIAHQRRALPTRFLDEEDHIDQLRRCLTDPALPAEARIAGALVRLYAMPLTRVAELTADRVHHDNNDTFLTLRANPVLLPPSLAVLIDQQLVNHQRGVIPGKIHYLFPGTVPNRPLRPESLGVQLLRHDLGTPAAHNTAMAMLVTDLPAVIVSDMIGINIRTANQWLGYARTNWTDYLAARQEND